MTRLRFLTAGESHGPALVGILDGMPAGVPLLVANLERDLQRRKLGYGRGGRMKIEPEMPRILSGVRHGRTLGSPIAVLRSNNVSSQVSTVDDADLAAGQTVAMQALAVELAGGKAGSYGFTANGATAIAPSPAPTPSASASATPSTSTTKKKKAGQ